MNNENKLIVYQTDDGAIALKADAEQETVWATRMQMAEIFGVNPQAISKHIKNIYVEEELEEVATSSKMELVQDESGRQVRRQVKIYNLDVLISVGYRINSKIGTKFRKWATKTLKQHITQGYTINPIQWFVIPAKAGIHHATRLFRQLDSRLRGNDHSVSGVIAESDPTSKERMIGLVIFIAHGENKP